MQIMETISSCVTALIAVASLLCAVLAYQHQKERAKKESACHLAKFYANRILQQGSFIEQVFEKSKILKEIKKIFPFEKLNQFDKKELQSLLNEHGSSIEVFRSKYFNLDPLAILSARMYTTNRSSERHELSRDFALTKDESGEQKVTNHPFLMQDFFHEFSNFLNDLEWFGMCCSYGVADEKLLYQSLHETFLTYVSMSYFLISERNKSSEGKLYTNVIWLFLQWRDRLSKIKEDATKQQTAINENVYAGGRGKVL